MGISAVDRIDSTTPAGPPGRADARGSGFAIAADPVGSAMNGPAGAASIPRPAPVSASLMLALQEAMTSETGDREARQHGQKLLAGLAELQRALLSGEGGDALGRLLVLVETMPTAADPGLAQVISSVRLRVRIELTRAAAALDRAPRPAV